MEKTYEAKPIEARWYPYWLERGYFQAGGPDGIDLAKPPYCITVPPPNVTGVLHIGHALNHTIQDLLGRWKRMDGHDVLVLPGIDHAGIATQSVVEKELAREGLTRQALGRDAFVERVWQWKERYGRVIIHQLQQLGCAYDWSRERFTMDPGYADAIVEEFVRLFDLGLIYRGARVINWCPFHETAISDVEVEYVERDSFLWHIRYDFADGDGSVVVATTRPETLLGDTAVAVNPADPRYAGMQGRRLIVPLAGRDVPLIFDDYASMEFGTGAVKVTPAHDLNDFEAGRRHHLPQIVVIGESGRMTAAAGDAYAGLTREEARSAVERDLEEQGALVGKEPYRHSVATCERCHTVIEPLLSEQWFARMAGTELVERATDAVRQGRIAFVPERGARLYTEWMEGIRDWCISRQLWWGHRIPIYYAPDGRFTAARSAAEAAGKLGLADAGGVSAEPDWSAALRQDEDVLDTWFSSALWPFATLGWPGATGDLARYYPTDFLTTAQEILYLWVARMAMMGLEFTGEIPFKTVYIHATVLDKQGRRMQKSVGNGIDPLEMIERYGADALRYSLVRLASKRQDIRFSEERLPEARNFCTKIWNASRFVLLSLAGPGALDAPAESADAAPLAIPRWDGDLTALAVPERWILTRLQRCAERVGAAYASCDLDIACAALYELVWNDYCDWFVELAKPALRSDAAADKERVRWVLWHVLESALRLMHPVMPFITEEIWHALPHLGDTISRAAFPHPDPALIDDAAARQMETIIAAIRGVRNARGELKVAPSLTLDATVVAATPELRALVASNAATLQSLARLNPPTYSDAAPAAGGVVAVTVEPGLDIYLPLAGMVDMEKECQRLRGELAGVDKDLEKQTAKLANPQFMERAAADVVAKAQASVSDLGERRAKLVERAAALGCA